MPILFLCLLSFGPAAIACLIPEKAAAPINIPLPIKVLLSIISGFQILYKYTGFIYYSPNR